MINEKLDLEIIRKKDPRTMCAGYYEYMDYIFGDFLTWEPLVYTISESSINTFDAKRIELPFCEHIEKEISIVGVKYHDCFDGKNIIGLREGDLLSLEFDPENPVDANAIKVCKGSLLVGYIPSADTEYYAKILRTVDSYQVKLDSFLDTYEEGDYVSLYAFGKFNVREDVTLTADTSIHLIMKASVPSQYYHTYCIYLEHIQKSCFQTIPSFDGQVRIETQYAKVLGDIDSKYIGSRTKANIMARMDSFSECADGTNNIQVELTLYFKNILPNKNYAKSMIKLENFYGEFKDGNEYDIDIDDFFWLFPKYKAKKGSHSTLIEYLRKYHKIELHINE